MTKLFDLKTNAAVEFKEDDAAMRLNLDGERYVPIKGEKYAIKDNETDQVEEVLGENLRQAFGNNKSLLNFERYAIRKQLESEQSSFGQALKSAANSALTLDLAPEFWGLRGRPENPWEEKVKEVETELFGGAQSKGAIVGDILPFLAGGLGGILRAGAKKATKAGVKAGLKRAETASKVAGALPSAQAIKAQLKLSNKAGDLALKGAKKLGIKKDWALKTIKGSGQGLGFAGGIAGLQSAKTMVRHKQADPLKDYEGSDKTHKQFASMLGAGADSFKETFKSSALLMGGLGFAGGVLKGSLAAKRAISSKVDKLQPKKHIAQGAEYLGTKARQQFLKAEGSSFFTNTIAKKNRADLRRAFDIDKKAPDSEVMRAPIRYIEGILKGKQPKTRYEAQEVITKHAENIGAKIGNIRNTLSRGWTWNNRDEFIKVMKRVRNVPDPVTRKGGGSGFVTQVDKLIDFLQARTKKGTYKNKISFKTINQFIDQFTDKANFAKGAAPTLTQSLNRKARPILVKYENKVAGDLLKKDKKSSKYVKELMNLKKEYQKSSVIKGIMDKGTMPGEGFLTQHTIKEIFMAGTLGIGSAIGGGVLGGPLGAGIGLAASLGVVGAREYARATGKMLLSVGNRMDAVQKYMSQSSSAQGVKKVFAGKTKDLEAKLMMFSEKAGIKEPFRVTTKVLGSMFGFEDTDTIEKLTEKIAFTNEFDQMTQGNEDISFALEKFGGDQAGQAFFDETNKVKDVIKQSMPKPTVDSVGRPSFSKIDTKKFLDNMQASLTPVGFTKAVEKGTLTRHQYGIFKNLYPKFCSEFNVSLQEGLLDGSIKETNAVRNYLNLQKGGSSSSDFSFFQLDQALKHEEMRAPQRMYRNTANQPTSSLLSQTGSM